MPRFAANLGFNPLQPLKPTTTSEQQPNSNTIVNHRNISTTLKPESVTNEVPAAQFDWNSAGLVNPLDGTNIKFKVVKNNFF